MAARRNKKIVKYRKGFRIDVNIGTVMFGLLFVYLLISVILYLTSSHVTVYEVTAGPLVNTDTYTAMALRTESVYNAEQAGNINYYAREGEKINAGGRIYSIDEGGRLSAALEENESILDDLSSRDISGLRTQMVNYATSYDRNHFGTTYNFAYEIESTLMDLVNTSILSSLSSLTESEGGMFTIAEVPREGIVTYFVDGYEELVPDEVTLEMFDLAEYEKDNLRGNELVNAGDPVYKLVTEEEWYLVFPINEKTLTNLEDVSKVEITFQKDNSTANADVTTFQTEEGTFAKLTLNHSMIRFASERYVEIELMINAKSGLKIPNSSVVEKDFYMVPKEYLAYGGDNNEAGFLREVYTDDGVSSEFVSTTLYYETEDEYYIDMVTFEQGDMIIMPDSANRYQISEKASLQGVYNINKGYAVFREITIIDQNEEYCIVEESSSYGLAQYDHIVLDSTTVKEEDIVY